MVHNCRRPFLAVFTRVAATRQQSAPDDPVRPRINSIAKPHASSVQRGTRVLQFAIASTPGLVGLLQTAALFQFIVDMSGESVRTGGQSNVRSLAAVKAGSFRIYARKYVLSL